LLYQFLVDRVRQNDYEGEPCTSALEVRSLECAALANHLLMTILKILSRCETLTNELLESTNLSKILLRFSKKGDEQQKQFVKRINDAVTNGPKKSEDAQPKLKSETPEPVRRSAPEQVAGVKRPRPAETAAAPSVKKVTTTASTATKTFPGTVKRVVSGTIAPLAKPSATKVIPKTTNLFSGLQSASKKPAITSAASAISKTATAG